MPWFTYILCCGDGALYTGSTTDLQRRLTEHQSKKGGHFTASNQPVALLQRLAAEDADSRVSALARSLVERQESGDNGPLWP